MPHNTKTNSDKVSKSAEAYPAGVRCQKCLKHGHWSYQCTNPRKISIRPSRTTIMKRHLTNKAVKLDPSMLKDEIKKLKKSSKKKEEDSSESSSDTDSDSSSSSSSSSSGSGSGSSSSDSSSSDSDSDSSSSISSSGN